MSKVPKKKPMAGAKTKPGQKKHVAGAGQAKVRDKARAAREHWGGLEYGRGGRPRTIPPPLTERRQTPVDIKEEFYRAQGR